MKFLKKNGKRMIATFLCFVLMCADILIPNSTVQAEESRTVGRYVELTSTESTSTSAFSQYGRQILPAAYSTTAKARMYVMHIPEDLVGTATITSTTDTATSIKMKNNYNRQLGFRLIHYRAEDDVNRVVYPTDGGWYNYSYTATYFMDEVGSIEVKAGDKLYFVMIAQASGGNRETYLNLSLNIAYGDTNATWKNSNATSSSCNHVGTLAADATTETSSFYGGTYTYGELLTYEIGDVIELVNGSVEMTSEEVGTDYTYETAIADYSASFEFKRSTDTTESLNLYFGKDSVGTSYQYTLGSTEYTDGEWHKAQLYVLLNRYFLTVDGRVIKNGDVSGLYAQDKNVKNGTIRIQGTDATIRNFAWESFDYSDTVAIAQFDAIYALCAKATEYGTNFADSGFVEETAFNKVTPTVNDTVESILNAISVDDITTIRTEGIRTLETLKSTRESVTVLSPEDSANFSTLTTKTGGALTALDEETVYFSNGWYGFSYKEAVTDYSWQFEFKSSTTSSDFRIYFGQPNINSDKGYILRLYQGYLMCYKPGRSGWFSSSSYVFKSSKEYRDGQWHTVTVNLQGGQFFVEMDGMRMASLNNMNNSLTAASEYIYTNYTETTLEDNTTQQVETDFAEGYVGAYGQDFYVRNFKLDFFNGTETVAKEQFNGLHTIYMAVSGVKYGDYRDTQIARALELRTIYREKVLSCITVDEVNAVIAAFEAEMAKVTFKDWIGSLDASEDSPIVVGSSYTTTDYTKQVAKNFRFDLDFTFAESNGDVRIYFCTNKEKTEGYLLRFYSGMTILYKAPFLGTADYWNNPATYAVFKSTAYNWQDGKRHHLSFNVCDNQFYLTIDGEFLTVADSYIYDTNYANNIYTNTASYGDMYLKMAGTNYTIHNFTTTSFSREEKVAQAQFENMYNISEYLCNSMEKSVYAGGSWERVTDTADSYTKAIRDCYDQFDVTKVNNLYREAIEKLSLISPEITFSIDEDFEDEDYSANLKVVAGTNAVAGDDNNHYLDFTSTWNVATTVQAAVDYKASVDFKAGDTNAVFFNFNMWNENGSRETGYMVRLYPNGEDVNIQLYRGDGSESANTWIWSYYGTDIYYRGDNWHNLTVLSYEGQMVIYLDNQLITPTSSNTAYTIENGVVKDETYKWGYFGCQSQSAIALDNLSIQPITSLEAEMENMAAYNDVLGEWYFNETDAVGEYWVTEDATLNVYEDQMNSLTLDSGSVALTGNAKVYTPHLALTFKATESTDSSVLNYYYATSGENGYCVKVTDDTVTLVRLDAGVETVLGTAEYRAFDTLNTIRVFQSAGNTYVYADATQLICVADTTYYQGSASVKAESLKVEVYKLVLGSSVENLEIENVAVKEDLVITLKPKVEDGQVYLGYVLSGGEYTGLLYNKAIGDKIEYFDGLTYKACVLDLKMNYGASARAVTGAGLRWKTTIPTEQYEQLMDMGFSVGTRITSVGSEKYVDIPLVHGLVQDEESGMTSWVASLINIKEANYERIYNGTAYVKGTYADGTEFQVSGVNDNNKRTYKGVVMAALADVKTSSTSEYATAIETVDGTSAYTYLTATKYEFLKGIYTDIESKIETDEDSVIDIKQNETDNKTEIHFVNVSNTGEYTGNALSAFIEYENQVILFDGGTEDSVSSARVIQCMKDEGIEKIDYLVISHEHHDHTGGLPTIIDALDVGTVYVRPTDACSDWMKKALGAAESKVNSDGTTVEIVIPRQEGFQVNMGEDTYFRIYNCTRAFEDQTIDGNYHSLQMHFVSGEGKAFFGGDAGGLYKNEEMLGKIGAVDIYQIQHHGHNALGSPYNPASLMDELQPKYSIASMAYNSSVSDSLQVYLEKYGHVYKTGACGISFTFKQGDDGHFCLKSEAEKGAYDAAKTVTIEGETELAFNGGSSRTDGQVYINGDRGMYLTSAYGKAAAHKITVPSNMKGEVLARFIGTDIYRTSTGEGTVYFRIIQNGTVVYETAFTGSQGGSAYNVNLSKTITLKAGDELYLATYCSEGATNTKLYCTMAMYLDGTYYDAGHSDHINTADDTLAISRNHFNGTLYNNGSYYTCGEVLSYVTFAVPEEWLFEVPEEAITAMEE